MALCERFVQPGRPDLVEEHVRDHEVEGTARERERMARVELEVLGVGDGELLPLAMSRSAAHWSVITSRTGRRPVLRFKTRGRKYPFPAPSSRMARPATSPILSITRAFRASFFRAPPWRPVTRCHCLAIKS
jgi:hypothetical protein